MNILAIKLHTALDVPIRGSFTLQFTCYSGDTSCSRKHRNSAIRINPCNATGITKCDRQALVATCLIYLHNTQHTIPYHEITTVVPTQI